MPDDEPNEWPDEAADRPDDEPTDEPPDAEPQATGEPAGEESAEAPPADELPADETTGRSPVGAMDRSSTELGPAGEGTRPGGAEEDSDASAEESSEGGAQSQDGASGSDEPLSELRDELSERGEVADEEFEELFEEIDVGTVDEESLWEELSETAEEPLFAADAETVPDADVTVVEKSLCHRCPHFGDPPELHCTHEGTTIDAEVDTGHFRVVDCPVVAQRSDVDASDFSTDDL